MVKVQCLNMPVQELSGEMLCEQVAGIVGTQYFVQAKGSGTEAFLCPELAGGQVAYLADTGAPTNADGGTGVGVHIHLQCYTQIGSHTL